MNYQYKDLDEQLTNSEIDQISKDLGYSHDTPVPKVDRSKWFNPEANQFKSISQSIYSSDSLTNNETKLEIISTGELSKKQFPPNRWVIDRLVPENGITCISGKPKAGKSFWTLYLAICLALGIKFLDEFETQKSSVLFISKEDPQRLIQERIGLLTNTTELPLYFCTDPKLFLDTDRFIKEIIEIVREKNIKVIIIDSFRRIFKGEENSSQVIADVQNKFKALLDYGITIIFIHHHGKEGFFKKEASDKLRGSSDILAMLDSLLILERKDDTTLKINQAALRSDKPVNPFSVKFPTFIDDDNKFKFLDFLQEETEKIEQAKEEILVLLQSGMHNQTDIIQKLTPSGKYGPTTVKNALKELLETRKLDYITQGNKKLYLIPEQEGQGDE